ncbi:MAG: type II toxin-antitoxin system PemK/MazF family toxin [Gemmatimonadota bacterium]
MKRGDIVTVVLPGRYGKPRPGLIVQEDAFEALPSVTLLPLASDVRDLPLLRVPIAPGPESGVRTHSQVQIDKIMTVPRTKLGLRIGSLDDSTMRRVNEALGGFLGLG